MSKKNNNTSQPPKQAAKVPPKPARSQQCEWCGAARNLIDQKCPYCGRVYEDRYLKLDIGTSYKDMLEYNGIIYECRGVKRFKIWSHPDGRVRITHEDFIFEDFEDPQYSFTLKLRDLKHATITKPRGFWGLADDILIIMPDGSEYEVGLDEGKKEEVLELLKIIFNTL